MLGLLDAKGAPPSAFSVRSAFPQRLVFVFISAPTTRILFSLHIRGVKVFVGGWDCEALWASR